MNNEFQLDLKEDEWMDVTAREELLQNELTQVKATLAMRSKELEESVMIRQKQEVKSNDRIEALNKLVEELRDQNSVQMAVSIALEDSMKKEQVDLEVAAAERERELNDALDDSRKELDMALKRMISLEKLVNDFKQEKEATRQHIAQLKASSEQHAKQLGKSLSQREKEVYETRDQIKSLTKVNKDLNAQKASLERATKEQQQVLANTSKKLIECNAAYDAMVKELMLAKETTALRSLELREAKGSTQKIAVLAEELKAEKSSLERNLQQQVTSLVEVSHKLEKSGNRETALMNELFQVKANAEQRVLEAEVARDTKQKDLNDARELIETLVKLVAELKDKTAALETTCEELKTTATQRNEASAIVVHDLEESCRREEALRKELVSFKAAAQDRLKTLKTILGVEETPKPFSTKVFEVLDFYYQMQQRLRNS